MENLRPNGERAKHAITLIWIMLAFEVIGLISGYLQYDLLQTAANGGEISMSDASANDTREQIIGILYTIAFIISAVTFIRWFRRAYFNLYQRVPYLRWAEGWAAGSWFVPFLNLYRPYQIMKELYSETKNLLTKNEISAAQNLSIGLLGWWWALWIISNLVGQFVFRYSLRADSVDELITSTIASMVGQIVGIPLALIAVKVIDDYAKVEPLLHQIGEEGSVTKQPQAETIGSDVLDDHVL